METAWIQGLIGGLLIGASAALYLLYNGRIAGMTGILRNVVSGARDEGGVLSSGFLVGAFLAALAFAALFGDPAITVTTDVTVLLVSGLIVGVGASYGGGCTSGHGVVGLTRLSPRSIVAVATFMGASAVTVFVLRHVMGVYF
jgi:uncharacterized membrane protein YedE/YeeE